MDVKKLQEEIMELKAELQKKEKYLQELRKSNKVVTNPYNSQMSTSEISRYSRQMLIPEIGIHGQVALKKSKVLIVGVGGLGCPAALYLAAAGVGEITLVDSDEVDITNLHRQILHSEPNLGIPKVISAYGTLTNLNSNIRVIPLNIHADSRSLLQLLNENKYDVVVDGSDNVPTRYLLNDLCVMNQTPLVSGSALQMEGQLTVYHYGDGPCYRCLFPVPPPAETVTSCGDGGVLGVVPGIIGLLEALETIKIITGLKGVMAGRFLIFDAMETSFTNVKLRSKNTNCVVCGLTPTITKPIDYEQFCGAKAHDKVENINILRTHENINVTTFSQVYHNDNLNQLLLDVRPKIEFEMCHLPKSLNIPFSDIQKNEGLDDLKRRIAENSVDEVYLICRRGNDSQRALSVLQQELSDLMVKLINIKGGFHAYSNIVDSTFPIY